MITFFTADTHFCHRESIPCFQRPFADVESMNQELISNWNLIVGPRDLVYHLGDFGYGYGYSCVNQLKVIFKSLNGYKILIMGNHDIPHILDLPWQDVNKRLIINLGGRRIHLSHCPIKKHYQAEGLYYIHGHTHGRSFTGIDVGVDCHHFFPVSFPILSQTWT